MLLQPIGLLKLMLNLFHTINERALYSGDFIKYTFTLACFQMLQVSFKFHMMIKTTKLNSLIPVCMNATFVQGHRVESKRELLRYFYDGVA